MNLIDMLSLVIKNIVIIRVILVLLKVRTGRVLVGIGLYLQLVSGWLKVLRDLNIVEHLLLVGRIQIFLILELEIHVA